MGGLLRDPSGARDPSGPARREAKRDQRQKANKEQPGEPVGDGNLGLRETLTRNGNLEEKTDRPEDPGDQAPTLSSEMLRCAKEYVDFQLSTPSEINPTTWTQAMSLGDRLVTACHHSVALATVALRRTYDPGGLVPERDLASMESFLDLEVLPKELAEVKRDRAYHGVPSYFETPPSRQGPDSIQPSLRDQPRCGRPQLHLGRIQTRQTSFDLTMHLPRRVPVHSTKLSPRQGP